MPESNWRETVDSGSRYHYVNSAFTCNFPSVSAHDTETANDIVTRPCICSRNGITFGTKQLHNLERLVGVAPTPYGLEDRRAAVEHQGRVEKQCQEGRNRTCSGPVSKTGGSANALLPETW